uniref:SGNH hydrolase-type esterase domain-containing protein n=1 Tax=Takifugu rubripes TaxID=31033 RepID=A0A674MCA6_TAKRU
MAPPFSSSGCANCAYLAGKIQELEQRISTLYQIQEAERFIDTIVFKEPHPESIDASDPNISARNTTAASTSPPAVHPLISPDASSTKHAAGPRGNLKPRASSTPSQQEQWSQIGARTGKTKHPPQASLFHLHLENKFTPLDHYDSPVLPALSRTLSIRLSDGTGCFLSSSSRPPPPAPVPDHPIPGPLQRHSLSSNTPAPQLSCAPSDSPPRPLFPPTTLIIGDSIVRNIGFFNATTRCFPGARVLDILLLLPTLLKTLPASIKRIMVHVGTNDTFLRQSELTKDYFTKLLNLLKTCGLSPFISGPLPTLGRGYGRFSRVLSLHTWLHSACQAHNIAFVDNFDLFWNRPCFFKSDGIHPNHTGSRMLAANLQDTVHSSPYA